MRQLIFAAIFSFAGLAVMLTPTANASDVIRLGRDVMPQSSAPVAQHPQRATYRIKTAPSDYGRQVVSVTPQPQQYQPVQPAVHQRQRPIHTPATRRHDQRRQQPSAIEKSAYKITRSAFNTTTYEIKRGVTKAIRDGFRRVDF